MKTPKLILAGGRGDLGHTLSEHFCRRGWEVIVLTRSPRANTPAGVRDIRWDGEHTGDWTGCLEGADAVINLAGQSVNCRYTARNRKILIESRVLPTRALGQAIAQCAQPPKVWMNASTATIYRQTFGPAWDEDGEIGAHPDAKDAFSIEIATRWENAAREFTTPQTRLVLLRTAMVLGWGDNSVLPVLRRLVRFGLGGSFASGDQYVSWIHQLDFCRAVEWIITHRDASGILNLAAPNPLTNREMMATLRELCGRRIGLPAPRWMLEVGAFFLRTETELIIKSRRVVSRRLAEGGFVFEFGKLRVALVNLLDRAETPF